MGLDEIATFAGDVFTGGAISATKARKDAARSTKKQQREAERLLIEEKELAATAESTAQEEARKKREREARKGAGDTVRTSPVGLGTATPGTPKTLLGQ